ncbi:glycosyltransferase family 2 protein [Niabella yanshanensis]|uniref:Glycosyltransferase family 2 protein n=1 Tax=Niabella yanshanensis TaxID=577386 RepID=A0ABZ0W483_9BACT|nr:glycosyltransferase family 2 protein [Niabella yanshanensis]WQD36900.1 glycosyltransferase family 2 protein [Niabella yanshanensis]
MFTVSVLITTYNWPEALTLSIQSVLLQSILPMEIVICDDGSADSTRLVVNDLAKSSPIPIIHIWQEDQGFRVAQIRNKGIAAAKGDYIIQIDGDIILQRDFVRDHIRFAKHKYFATGSRVLFSKRVTDQLLISGLHLNGSLLFKSRNKLNEIRLPFLQEMFAGFYKNRGRYQYYVKGCNMAFWKKDLLLVNGYDESFIGWGREDNDIAIRLINSGIKKRFLKFGAVCYHFHHPIFSRDLDAENIKKMTQAISQKLTFVEKGLSQYL